MEVKNGIIIDGVLHEMIMDFIPDACKTCSLRKQCDKAGSLYKEWLCNIFNCYHFVNRGKVKIEKVEETK